MSYLRELGRRRMEKLASSPLADDVRTDMREQVKKVIPEFNRQRGRWVSVDRRDLANATKRTFDGLQVGLYREGRHLYPILLRSTDDQRDAGGLSTLQIQPQGKTETVPLAQVVDAVETTWEDPIIIRYNRRRAITVQGSPSGRLRSSSSSMRWRRTCGRGMNSTGTANTRVSGMRRRLWCPAYCRRWSSSSCC